MRSVLLTLAVLLLAAGPAIADNANKVSTPQAGFKKEKVVKLRGGLYTKMYLSLFYKTQSLDLDQKQKSQLNKVGREYAGKIMDEENKSKELRREFMNQLETGKFSSSKLKSLAGEIIDANTKTINSFIAGIAEIERIIGAKNYARLAPISKFDRNTLVKLKQVDATEPIPLNGEAKTEAENN